MRSWLKFCIIAPLFLAGCSHPFFHASSSTNSGNGLNPRDPAAKIGGEVITWGSVMEGISENQYQLDLQAYQMRKKRIDELIDQRLLAKAAAQENMSESDYVEKKVSAAKKPVTDEEIHAFYEERKGQLPGEESAWSQRIRTYLEQQRESQARNDLLADLRKGVAIEVSLKEPARPRFTVAMDNQPMRGPADAPVTIVEFSDFQCPFCSKAEQTVAEVMKTYPTQVRLVYRDFPLTSIHPNAQAAAEAADCAYQTGKYWEYHDDLFQNQTKLSREDLVKYAETVGLDAKRFADCLDGGRGKAGVELDKRDGNRLGVTGTPTFFINGRRLSGAQPLESFKKAIDEELASLKR